MDRILIILKTDNGPRASSAPTLGLNTIIFKHVYWYMQQISGKRLQDHWSSGSLFLAHHCQSKQPFNRSYFLEVKIIVTEMTRQYDNKIIKHKTQIEHIRGLSEKFVDSYAIHT